MTDQPSTPSTPSEGTVTWHALTPQAALERQGVTVERGLTQAEADSRRAKYGPNKFAEPPQEPRWQAFLRQYRDPMQIVLLAAGVLSLFLPGQVATGVVLIGLTLLNAAMGLNQEGKANASVAALQKMMVVSAKVRRDGSLVQLRDGAARARRHRQHRGRRPGPGRRTHPDRGHARDRRIGPDRRERPGPQAGRGRRRGGRARRPGGPRVHEHAGDPGRRHDPRDEHRHDHRGRPHQRHAQRDEGRGHTADAPAQRVDQPDPRHRRVSRCSSRSASACGATPRSTSCS